MTDPTQALRQSIYTALNGNVLASLGGQTIPCYSFIAAEKPYPFIALNPVNAQMPINTKDITNDLHEITFLISVVVGYNGDEGSMADVEYPSNQIINILHNNRFSISGYNCILAKYLNAVESHEIIDTGTILTKILTMQYIIEHT